MIPKKLQSSLLKELHSTHVGIVKMKALARNYCWWENIDKDIEQTVKSCKECCDVQKSITKAPVHFWDQPAEKWQRLHMDYAGPFQGHYFLLVVDAFSKWIEAIPMTHAPTAQSTIQHLIEIFSRFGLPSVMVSDNASIFQSGEFKNFCIRNGIKQKFIAPGHPASNGQAERQIQTVKNKLKAMKSVKSDFSLKLQQILMKYRSTPLSNGKTPSELMLGSQIRTRLDLIRPHQPSKIMTIEPKGYKTYKTGDRVQIRAKPGDSWKYGIIEKRLGKLHYTVRLDNGRTIKSHYNQMRRNEVPLPSIGKDQDYLENRPRRFGWSTPQESKPDGIGQEGEASRDQPPLAEGEPDQHQQHADPQVPPPAGAQDMHQEPADLQVSLPAGDPGEQQQQQPRRSQRVRRPPNRFTF